MKTNHKRNFVESRKTTHSQICRILRGWPVKKVEVGDKTKRISPERPYLDPANGHRGRARGIAGAKKYMRTRLRFHENQETQKIANSLKD
jgi:hypothetical protein